MTLRVPNPIVQMAMDKYKKDVIKAKEHTYFPYCIWLESVVYVPPPPETPKLNRILCDHSECAVMDKPFSAALIKLNCFGTDGKSLPEYWCHPYCIWRKCTADMDFIACPNPNCCRVQKRAVTFNLSMTW